MDTLVLYLALGLGSGAIYASLALGLIVINRGTNVIMFGYASIMMMGTLVYGGLRADGLYIVPIPGVPSIRVTDGPTGAALGALLAIATTMTIAALCHFVVFRSLRNAPVLARVAAAVGVLILLQAIALMHYGSVSVAPPGVLPTNVIKLFGARVLADRFYLAGIAVVLALVLWAFFKYTTVGLALRACAENERGAAVLGWSTGRLALLAWLLGGLLAGGMGVLAAPIVAVDPSTYALLIVPALGVALIGQFRSFTLCLVGGLALGMAQSVLQRYAVDVSWIPSVGIQDGLPFVVIIVVLALRGRVLSTRGAAEEGTHPIAYAPRRVAVRLPVLVGVAVILVCTMHGGLRYALISSMIGVLLALSVLVVTGYAGMLSLAQLAFAGVAGLTLSKLAHNLGIPFPIAPLLAALCAMVAGVIIGLPALRFRGISLAIITLAAGSAVYALAFQNPSLTGGYGGTPVPTPKLFGWNLGISAAHGDSSLTFTLGCLFIVVLAALAMSNLRRSGSGRRMLAIRANDRAAAAAGLNVAAVKLQAFALSAFIAGVAGTMISYQQAGGNISFDLFAPTASILLLAAVFIGGVSTVAGSVLAGLATTGGLMYYALSTQISGYSNWELLIGGIGMIQVAVMQPDGLAGFNIGLYREVTARWKARNSPSGPPPRGNEQAPDNEPSAVDGSSDAFGAMSGGQPGGVSKGVSSRIGVRR